MGAATPDVVTDDSEQFVPAGDKGFDTLGEGTQEAVFRVGTSSDVKQLASSISFALQDSRKVTLRGIGAGSVNQMVKACAVARGFVAARGVDLIVRPGFQMVAMRDRANPGRMVDTTAVILVVQVI